VTGRARAGGDAATLAFYTRSAAAYADYAAQEERSPRLARFAAMLPRGGDVLDFGCGSGWAANELNRMGLHATGVDGSAGLAAEARRRYGLDVAVGPFEQLDAQAAFDGIWAGFSLLHDRHAAMPGHLARLQRALRPGGVLYLGLKEGDGESRDSLGRFYSYFRETEISGMLAAAGFTVLSSEVEPARGFDGALVASLHVLARRGRG
jgi:SAM-dependent methyltransferase